MPVGGRRGVGGRAPPTIPIPGERGLRVQQVLSSHMPCYCFLIAGGQIQKATCEPPAGPVHAALGCSFLLKHLSLRSWRD